MTMVKTRKIRDYQEKVSVSENESFSELKDFNDSLDKSNIDNNTKMRKRKLRKRFGDAFTWTQDDGVREFQREEKEALSDDSFSIGMIVLILVLCLFFGVSVGYILYRLAINSSALILIFSLMN